MTNLPNQPNQPIKVFGFNLDFITALIVILGGFTAYILNNQVVLEKRLTTIEVKTENQDKTYNDLQDSINKLDGKIDKLIDVYLVGYRGPRTLQNHH
jgi:hypothetical protein